jgi:hypothetical protein
MKSMESICKAGKAVGKRWMRRPALAGSSDRLMCNRFEVGKKIAIKLNVLAYATT